jgi:PEGA domain
MNQVPPSASDQPGPSADEGFGRLSHGPDPETGDPAEFLELAPVLVEHAGFVTALADRVARFATVRHTSYVHLRRLDRPDPDRLVLVSDLTPGWRLSDLLRAGGEPLESTVVIGMMRQLLPAVALFSRHNRESAIGVLAPERLIITPQARVVIAEQVFGPPLEKLNFGRDRLWREFRVAMPPSAGLPRANPRADAHALGLVALSMLLGRPLDADEFPGEVAALVESATERRDGQSVPLSPSLAQWLAKALQIDVRTSFQSPHEAQVAFEAVLASERSYVTTPAALERWVKQLAAALAPPLPPVPEPVERVEPVELFEPAEPAEPVPVAEPLPLGEPVPVAEPLPPAEPVAMAEPLPPAEPVAVAEPLLPAEPVPQASRRLVPVLVGLVVLLLAIVGYQYTRGPAAPLQGEGELVVTSRPASARVVVDGEERGVTPITVPLPAGAHVLEVQIGTSEPRVIPLTIRAGVQTSQYIELQGVPVAGGLDVRSEPSGARVTVDGRPRGSAPVSLRDLTPGDHEVVLEAGGRKVRQVVRIEAGVTAQLVVPLPRR